MPRVLAGHRNAVEPAAGGEEIVALSLDHDLTFLMEHGSMVITAPRFDGPVLMHRICLVPRVDRPLPLPSVQLSIKTSPLLPLAGIFPISSINQIRHRQSFLQTRTQAASIRSFTLSTI